MSVNDYNDPIAEAADEINRLRDQLELKDEILKSVARQGIEQKALITELADALEILHVSQDGVRDGCYTCGIIHRARETTK